MENIDALINYGYNILQTTEIEIKKSRYSGWRTRIKKYETEKNSKLGLELKLKDLKQDIDLLERYKNTDTPAKPTTKRKIFIIHGHDNELKALVEGFIREIELIPIILNEQANQGKTIIEKIEGHNDVDYAIALMTPDDSGASNQKRRNIKKRARQNVIFELGYFMGKLGRNRVTMIKKDNRDDFEVPSDCDGFAYSWSHENWQKQLVNDLKTAGFKIDANKLYK